MNLGGSIHVIYNHWVHFWFYLACYQCANAIVKSYKIIGTVSKIFPSISLVWNYTNIFSNCCHADFHHGVGMFAWVSHEAAVGTEYKNSNQSWDYRSSILSFSSSDLQSNRPTDKNQRSFDLWPQKTAIFWPLTPHFLENLYFFTSEKSWVALVNNAKYNRTKYRHKRSWQFRIR